MKNGLPHSGDEQNVSRQPLKILRLCLLLPLLSVCATPLAGQSNKPVVGMKGFYPRSSPVTIKKGEERTFQVYVTNLVSRKRLSAPFYARGTRLTISYPGKALSIRIPEDRWVKKSLSRSGSRTIVTLRFVSRTSRGDKDRLLAPGQRTTMVWYYVKALQPGNHSLSLNANCDNCLRSHSQTYVIRVPGTVRTAPARPAARTVKKPPPRPRPRATTPARKATTTYKKPEPAKKTKTPRKKYKRPSSTGMPGWLYFVIMLGGFYAVVAIGKLLIRVLKPKPKRTVYTSKSVSQVPPREDYRKDFKKPTKPKMKRNLDPSPQREPQKPKLNLNLQPPKGEETTAKTINKPSLTLNLAKEAPEKEKEDKEAVGIKTSVIPVELPADGKSVARVTAFVFNLEERGVPGKKVTLKASPEECTGNLSRTAGISDQGGMVLVDFVMPAVIKDRKEISITASTTDNLGNRIASAAAILVRDTKPADLIITVRSERDKKKGLAEAEVAITGIDSGVRKTQMSQPDGVALFQNIPAGNYRIETSKKYYEPDRVESFFVQPGEETNHPVELTGSRMLVNRMLKSENRLHDQIVSILVAEKDSYLQTLAWEIAGFVSSIYEEITGSSTGPEIPQIPGKEDLLKQAVNGGVSLKMKGYEFLVGEIWDVVTQYLPVPKPEDGFTAGDVRAAVVSLATHNESALMEQAIKMLYIDSFTWEKHKTMIGERGVQSLGDNLDASGYGRALIYAGCLLSFARYYFKPKLQSVEDYHTEMHQYWGERDDPELMDVFKQEDKFQKFDQMINQQADFLRHQGGRLKTYRLNNSKIKEILNMGKKFFDDILGGEDMYRTDLVHVWKRSINNLPLSIQGYNYFVATSSVWGVLGLIPETGPHDKAFRKLVDMGFKFGAFACLALGMLALNKDITHFAEMLSELVISSQHESMADQMVSNFKNFKG